MVQLSLVNFIKRSGYDSSFKKHKIFRLAAKFFGRRRNCFSIAVRAVQKSLLYATKGRKVQHQYVHELRMTRLRAACAEHDRSYSTLKRGLRQCDVSLTDKVLADLAIWEPKTFKCLTDIAEMKNKLEAPPYIENLLPTPKGIITRGML